MSIILLTLLLQLLLKRSWEIVLITLFHAQQLLLHQDQDFK